MTTGTIVTIVNQTGRPATFNLAPVSDQSVSLPPHGRIGILEEELAAYEVDGAINSTPPRLAVIRPKPVAQESVTPAKTIPKQEPASETQPEEPAPVEEPATDEPQEDAPEKKPKSRFSRKSKRAKR